MSHKITVFRGDGIGPELVDNVLKILKAADAPLETRAAHSRPLFPASP